MMIRRLGLWKRGGKEEDHKPPSSNRFIPHPTQVKRKYKEVEANGGNWDKVEGGRTRYDEEEGGERIM